LADSRVTPIFVLAGKAWKDAFIIFLYLDHLLVAGLLPSLEMPATMAHNACLSIRFDKVTLMAVRSILRMGAPILLRQAAPVLQFDTPELRALLVDMFDTMAAAGGVGLAAPQIGVSLQLVIFGFERNERYPEAEPVPRTVLINPLITALDDEETLAWEGCLSVPGLRGEVPRLQRIRYQGFDENGKPIDRAVEGFHARVVQHECDHLIGRLFPSRLRDFARFGFTDALPG